MSDINNVTSIAQQLLHQAKLDNPNSMLDTAQQLRIIALTSLMANPAELATNPQLATNVNQFINSMDKQTLTKIKLENDKEANNNSNDLVMQVFNELVQQHGRSFTISTPNSPSLTTAIPQNPNDVVLPANEFNFTDSEIIQGNDTENSLI